jgi:hypothetical protein
VFAVKTESNENWKSPLVYDFNRLKVLIARFSIMKGELKEKAKVANITLGQLERIKSDEEDIEVAVATIDPEKNMPKEVSKFLNRLTKEIEKMESPDQKRLNSFLKAIFILQELVSELKFGSTDKEIATLEILRAIRLMNFRLKSLKGIWTNTSTVNQVEIEDESND